MSYFAIEFTIDKLTVQGNHFDLEMAEDDWSDFADFGSAEPG